MDLFPRVPTQCDIVRSVVSEMLKKRNDPYKNNDHSNKTPAGSSRGGMESGKEILMSREMVMRGAGERERGGE